MSSFGSITIRILLIFIIYRINLLLDASHADDYMHPRFHRQTRSIRSIDNDNAENHADYWRMHAQHSIEERLNRKVNHNIAKNVILFLGDGMSIPTISAARVYLGGEERDLQFDKFPYTGLSKTYCTDHQVADSACSATAYLGGVKGNLGTIGVNGFVNRNNCEAMINTTNHIDSLAYYSQLRGKRTGLVTTARVTHASPAGVYAHTANRDWESDSDIIDSNENPKICPDIAQQLIYGKTGRNLNVILGGGRAEFLPKSKGGKRTSEENLIHSWLNQKRNNHQFAEYVSNRDQLLNVSDSTDYLLGLFDMDHCKYNLERDPKLQPSLSEMTASAIKLLQKGPNGFFLFVEGARIDMGHHDAKARKALDETVQFSAAVQTALNLVDIQNTLIIVTSDHAHTMSYSGYANRGKDILGVGGEDTDSLPYTILNYANGPGYKKKNNAGNRYDLRTDDISDMNYQYPGIFPMASETHGGDDVAIFAIGPWAHLFTGVMEQNVIPHLISFASCVGDGSTACDVNKKSRK